MLRFAALLAVFAFPLAGCGLVDDCSFPIEESRVDFASVSAAVPEAGDTLAVVFVQTSFPYRLDVYVRAGVEERAEPSSDGDLDLIYSARAELQASVAPQLETRVVGDTVYVYPEGADALFRPACSPPESWLRVDVEAVRLPAGVSAVTVTVIEEGVVGEAVFGALRQPAVRRAHFI